MDSHQIIARDIPEAWHRTIRHTLAHGCLRSTPTGAYKGESKLELGFTFLEIREPWRLPLLPDVPTGLPQPTDMKEVDEWVVNVLSPVPGGALPNYYGPFFEPQINYAIQFYKNKENWDSDMMCFLAGDGSNIMLPDPWVLKVIDTRIDHAALEIIGYFRGLEVYGGVPRFAAVLHYIQKYMSEAIDVKQGPLYLVGKAFSLYQSTWRWAEILCPSITRLDVAWE